MRWYQTDFYHETEAGEFWPSFTDIMMVIVMTFLLVTVAMVLSNTRLLEDLRASLQAEQQAAELAEITQEQNLTLEEQVALLKERLGVMEMNVLRARSAHENTKKELLASQQLVDTKQQSLEQALSRVDRLTVQLDEQKAITSTQSSKLAEQVRLIGEQTTALSQQQLMFDQATSTLEERSITIDTLRAELDSLNQKLSEQQEQSAVELAEQRSSFEAKTAEQLAELTLLQSNIELRETKLTDLQGEFDELDEKYQKLLKPSRSSKGKTVAEVTYRRSGIRLKMPDSNKVEAVTQREMDERLTVLKDRYGNDLYVKIIIPEDSGLSYNEAWRFTRETLNQYDYYYQE